jgi:hypothetical protein
VESHRLDSRSVVKLLESRKETRKFRRVNVGLDFSLPGYRTHSSHICGFILLHFHFSEQDKWSVGLAGNGKNNGRVTEFVTSSLGKSFYTYQESV